MSANRNGVRSIVNRRSAKLAGLVALALASALLYQRGIAAVYPLARGLENPRWTWPPFVDYELSAGLRHAAVYALLMLGYALAVRCATHVDGPWALLVIAGGWLLCSAMLLRAYPGDSLDVFDYVFRGRMYVLFGASPLASTPDAFAQQPFYAHLGWQTFVDTYGPLWEYAGGAVSWLVQRRAGSLVAAVYGYRLLALALMGLCAGLIGVITHRIAPREVPAALVLWLWNPLVLVSSVLGAHNDVLMLVFVLASVALAQRRRWLLALLALGLAAHVKLTALLLLPVLGLWIARRAGWRRAFVAGATALVVLLPLSWLLYAPLGGWATLPRMLRERTMLVYNSPANIVYGALQVHGALAEPDARRAVTIGSTLLFAALAAPLLWRFYGAARSADERVYWRASAAIVLAYLVVGSFWFQSWYVQWVIVFAALLPAGRLAKVYAPLYALGALCSNLLTDFLNQDPARRVGNLGIATLMVVVLLAPPAAAWLAMSVWRLARLANRANHW